MTLRDTENFDTYYDEMVDEQYQIDTQAADDFPKLVRLDLTPIKEARERMREVIREIDLRLVECATDRICDPALDPDNEQCSCGRMTENYPVICDECKFMSSID